MASLDELQSKYKSVLDKGHEVGLTVQNLNLDGINLLEVAHHLITQRRKLWDAIKSVDGSI
jgi:hypothetical protein